jgi:hypothetical protein
MIDILTLNHTQSRWLYNELKSIYIVNKNNCYKIINILNNIKPNLNKLKLGSFYIISKILKEYNNDDTIEIITSSLNIIVTFNESLHYYSSMLLYRDPIKYSYYLNYINKEYFNFKLQMSFLQRIYMSSDDKCNFIIDILNIIRYYKNINNKFDIIVKMYEFTNNLSNKNKIFYITKLLNYINFELDDDIDYTFDSIYKDICIFYNKKITLFKLAYIECKKTNQEVYNQFIDNNL